MTKSPSIATLVRTFRAKVAANPDMYDDMDVVMWLIEDTGYRTWTPSEIGRAVKIPSHEAANHLRKLAGLGYIVGNHRGAWTRYGARR